VLIPEGIASAVVARVGGSVLSPADAVFLGAVAVRSGLVWTLPHANAGFATTMVSAATSSVLAYFVIVIS
jgi:hypothetical protein